MRRALRAMKGDDAEPLYPFSAALDKTRRRGQRIDPKDHFLQDFAKGPCALALSWNGDLPGEQ